MSLSVGNQEKYHLELLQHLASHGLGSGPQEGVTTLCSGTQRIKVQSLFLRNTSRFLKDIVPNPCPCSCTDTSIILPHTPSPALKTFVKLLHLGFIPKLSNDVIKGVMVIATALGMKNIIKDISDCEDHDISFDVSNTDQQIFQEKLKIDASIPFSDQTVNLHFPRSRIARPTVPNTVKQCFSNTFKLRVQEEYNCHPVGQYVGPYDQNEKLSLNAQLPKSNLDFTSYTEFIHDGKKCFEYETRNYESYSDLDKIKSYRIKSEIECADNKDEDDNINIYYTCQHKLCKIPCPCAHCNSDVTQCNEHKLRHPALFDKTSDAVSIRSSEQFCESESFFVNSYIIKFPGIPKNCSKCCTDLLNHESYHFEYHTNCRFCNPTFFKAKATSKRELDALIKDESDYFRRVCPYCDKIFCEAFVTKKHIENVHGEKPFKCAKCDKGFQSLIAKSYHEKSAHSNSSELHNCSECGKQFKSGIHLKQHVKYVHSEARKWSCDKCDTKFKQKRDLKVHKLKKHNISYSKEDYDEKKSDSYGEYKCTECEATFNYKKNLNSHSKNKHAIRENFKCDSCDSSFRNKRTLAAHKRSKHVPGVAGFSCSKCGKTFSEKRSLSRHSKSHDAEDNMED